MNKKIALPINDSLFVIPLDFAITFLISDLENGVVKNKEIIAIKESLPTLRANRLKNLEVNTILCGAVSDPLAIIAYHCGIEILSGLSGNVHEMIDAFVKGDIMQYHTPDFQPGFRKCCGYRNKGRFRGGRKFW